MSARPAPEQRLARERAEAERIGWKAYEARAERQRKRLRPSMTAREFKAALHLPDEKGKK